MLKKVLLLLIMVSSSMMAGFITLTTEQFQEEMKKDTVIIDIRRPEEWRAYGVIQGSHKLTFFDSMGRYDINAWMDEFTKLVKNKEQAFILVCAHANRTKVVGELLGVQLGYKNVFELDGGINYGWIDKGYETVK